MQFTSCNDNAGRLADVMERVECAGLQTRVPDDQAVLIPPCPLDLLGGGASGDSDAKD